ncbi:hypothetical protein C8R43DRAFT_1244334 [Mycena crocata]|nr:hypothetical protein C8R43DRAFT_1244334 [Mycena crocata]
MDSSSGLDLAHNGLYQVEDLWFSHGSLTVRAQNSIFRVSGAPADGMSSIDGMDGTPVVELHDMAEEAEPFLHAIFDSSSFMPPPSTTDLSDILAILRLSHKYDIQYLHRRALAHLSSVFPTELSVFLAMLNHFPEGFKDLKESVDSHLQVLRVLHEVNALWHLPSAYSRASKFPPEKLFAAAGWVHLPQIIRNHLYIAHFH